MQCLVGGSAFPAIYALTSNRKRKTYEQIIQVILDSAAAQNKLLTVQTIVSDYEDAWLRAVENLLPNVIRLGCFFHYTQACYRNIQTLGLSTLYDDDQDIRLLLRKFLALALLPRDQVKKCFKLLCTNSDYRIQSFIKYFKQQWMKDMSPDLWCVSDSTIRTNNNSEAYNRRFGSRMLHKHPNVWRFIYTLKNEEYNLIQKNMHQIVGADIGFPYAGRKRTKQVAKKTAQIVKLHKIFTDGIKTLEEMIFGLSFLVGEPISKKKRKKAK